MCLQIVEIVFKQFVERSPRHVGELKFGLFACAGRGASLGDVLLATSRGLRHLVDSTVAMCRQKAATKNNRHLIDDLALLEGRQLAIAAMRQYNLRNLRHEARFRSWWLGWGS